VRLGRTSRKMQYAACVYAICVRPHVGTNLTYSAEDLKAKLGRAERPLVAWRQTRHIPPQSALEPKPGVVGLQPPKARP